jgi:iron(III) transport system substrate-binding protein
VRSALLLLAACRVEVGPADQEKVACESSSRAGEVWIYTSMYQGVIDEMDPALRADLPGVVPRWYQAGSEKVTQRFEAESSAGASPACLLMTSDPFWYAELARTGRLRPHLAPNVLALDRGMVDPEGRWAASRVSLMVMGVNPSVTSPPTSFADLADPRFRGELSMPDPLGSGTGLPWLAFETAHGWDGVDALRENGLVAAGGNSAVQARIETGERPVGVLLLENVLAARRKGSPIQAIFPTDGAIAVPGPIAIPASCPNPSAAEAVYDWILGERGQEIIARGDMYPALPSVAPPAGAPQLTDIAVQPWSIDFVAATVAAQEELKRRWGSSGVRQ